MLKEIVLVVSIVILIITADILVQGYLNKTSDELIVKLEEIESSVDFENQENIDYEAIEKIGQEVDEIWSKHELGWTIIMLHSELDLIEISINNLKSALKSENIHDVLIEVNKSVFLVNHIRERDSLKWKNIF